MDHLFHVAHRQSCYVTNNVIATYIVHFLHIATTAIFHTNIEELQFS